MKKFWFHPATITVLILLAVATVLILGYNFWGWFGGTGGKVGKDGFPSNPKSGDEFTKDGVRYKFVCIEVNCITAPCPPVCTWQVINDAPSGDRATPVAMDRTSKEDLINVVINKSSGSQRLLFGQRTRFRNELMKLTPEQLRFVSSNQPLGMTMKELCEYINKQLGTSIDCSWIKS